MFHKDIGGLPDLHSEAPSIGIPVHSVGHVGVKRIVAIDEHDSAAMVVMDISVGLYAHQRGAHMSLSAYSILLHLSEAPVRALRMTELANRAYLSGSRTTRLVDELIADQLVTKQRNAADGRGFDVTLTEEGLAALQRAYPVHLRSVRARVLDHVDRSALPCFARAMTAIAESLK